MFQQLSQLSKLVRIKLLTLVIGIVFFTISFAEESTVTHGHKAIKILTYNVKMHDQSALGQMADTLKMNAPAAIRAKHLLKQLKTQNIDVIGLQEVTPSLLKTLLSQPWVKDYHVVHSLTERQLDASYILMEPYGQVIMSRFPVTYSESKSLKKTRLNRKLLLAQLTIHGTAVTFANIHLESFPEDGSIRAIQLQQVFKETNRFENAVVLGDFNFDNNQQPESSFLPESFSDPWVMINPKDKGATYSYSTKNGKRLDRVLINSKPWKPRDITLLTENNFEYNNEQQSLSDHLAVMIALVPKKAFIQNEECLSSC